MLNICTCMSQILIAHYQYRGAFRFYALALILLPYRFVFTALVLRKLKVEYLNKQVTKGCVFRIKFNVNMQLTRRSSGQNKAGCSLRSSITSFILPLNVALCT